LGILDRLMVPKKEVIIGIVLAIVIAFILPPVALPLLLLALFVLLVAGLLIMIFDPKNVTNLIIAWLAARSPASSRWYAGIALGGLRVVSMDLEDA